MRILIHDFGGYAFPSQLSLSLAYRGHTICHVYCASHDTTPPGMAEEQENAPPSLTISGLHLSEPVNKSALVKRWQQERAYGQLVSKKCAAFRPDIVLSGNTPLHAQKNLLAVCRKQNIPFVYWLQDLLGVAAYRLLGKKQWLLGQTVGRYFLHMERSLLRKSDAIVAITSDFLPLLQRYHVEEQRITVIENWANLSELPTESKNNAWSRTHDLANKTCLLYAGTLGMKHNPNLILQLARHFRDNDSVRVVVISQGKGANCLKKKKAAYGLDNLVLLGYQPKHSFPAILATADILLAVLEPDAGVFSVPSKVLSYLCAARPLLLAMPADNLAARIVDRAKAGIIVPPDAPNAFVGAATELLTDRTKRMVMGQNAHTYAEKTFAIEPITNRFSAVFERLVR